MHILGSIYSYGHFDSLDSIYHYLFSFQSFCYVSVRQMKIIYYILGLIAYIALYL